MDGSKVSIIIPAFNEEEAIKSVVTELRQEIPDAELIVVNDGSLDKTSILAHEAGAIVIDHPFQRGYGSSLTTGILRATRDYVLFCDADGQHRLEDVKKLISQGIGLDMIVGARGKSSHQPLLRRPGKFILRFFADYLAGIKIPDLNSGLRMFKKEVITRYLHLMPEGFSFSTTSTFAIIKSKRRYRYKYVPIKVKKRLGKSTVRQLRHGPQTLMLMLRLTVLFEPLKVFMAVTVFLSLCSLASLTNDLLDYRGLLGGGIADTTVLLSIATVIIFMTGLLCDQVSAMRREQHE